MTDKKTEKAEISYKSKVVPVEYEARGVFLGDLLKPDFVSKLRDSVGDFDTVNLIILIGEDMVSLWHKSSEDMKKGILTIGCKDPETMKRLSEALGIMEK